jgi:hypothetical protein
MEYERPPEIKDDRHWAWIVMVAGGAKKAEAARELGYSESSARNQGYKLGKRYKDVLERLIKEELEYLESNTHRILAATAALAFSSVANYIDIIDEIVPAELDEHGAMVTPESTKQVMRFKPWDEIDPADIEAIKRIECSGDGIKIWMHDKIKPLELIGQHENLWGKDTAEKVTVVHNSYYGDGEPPDFPTNAE